MLCLVSVGFISSLFWQSIISNLISDRTKIHLHVPFRIKSRIQTLNSPFISSAATIGLVITSIQLFKTKTLTRNLKTDYHMRIHA